ncbi:MAG: hypothetical protein ACKO5K_03820 [Armatimonadota bacterium]
MAGTKLRIGRETRIEVLPRSGVWLAPPLLVKQIARAGFEARQNDVLVLAKGRVARDSDGPVLTVDQPAGEPVVFRLSGADLASGKGNPLAEGGAVEVLGAWRAGGSGPATLIARKVRALDRPPG